MEEEEKETEGEKENEKGKTAHSTCLLALKALR